MWQISGNRRAWRIGLLLLMLLAITGPWVFDRVNVPSEYPCSGNYMVRLQGDFCGIPISGVRVFSMLVTGLPGISLRLMTDLRKTYREFLSVLSLLLLLLPVFSDLLLIVRGEQRRWQLLHVAAIFLALCLAAGFILLGLPVLSIPPWASWGIWLYIGLMLFALLFETLTLVRKRT